MSEPFTEYTEKWKELVEIEKIPAFSEDEEILRAPFQFLVEQQKAIPFAMLNKIKTRHGYYFIDINCGSTSKYNLKQDDYITLLDNGPKNHFFNSDIKVEIISGFLIQIYDQSIRISTEINMNYSNLRWKLKRNYFTLVIRPNVSLFPKYFEILNHLEIILKNNRNPQNDYVKALIDMSEERIRRPNSPLMEVTFMNQKLNDDQKAAVKESLSAKSVYALQGPPGTGKSTVVIEIIKQALKRDYKKILVCSSSHLSTDNIAEHFLRQKALRIGRKEKISHKIYPILLQFIIKKDKKVIELHRKIDKLHMKMDKIKTNDESTARKILEDECQKLQKELHATIITIKQREFENSSIVFSTINGSRDRSLIKYMEIKKVCFDLILIDESSQAPEIATWLPILNGKKLIITGDHMQLSFNPTSHYARDLGYAKSLLERCMESLPSWSKGTLHIQYRMNKEINEWPSKTFYNGKLIPDSSVANRTMRNLAKRSKIIEPLRLISTSGHPYSEMKIEKSYCNVLEAALVLNQVCFALENFKIIQRDIGVISPYAAQRDLIQKILNYNEIKVEVASVDGFQGREKELIILSLVRSNHEKKLGFITDPKRLNVAATRAKRSLILICDIDVVTSNPLIDSFCQSFRSYYDWSEIPRLTHCWEIAQTIYRSLY